MALFEYLKQRRNEAAKKKEEEKQAEALRLEQERIATEAQKKRIAESEIIAALFNEFRKSDWILNRQNGEDNGIREVRVTYDTVGIKWSKMNYTSRIVGQDKWGIDQYEKKYVEEIFGQVEYSFTKSGYAPLDKYDYQARKLFAEVITEGIEKMCPGAHSEYHHVLGNHETEYRRYTLPIPMRKMF